MTEWTNTSGENTVTQQSINEGVGSYSNGRSGLLTTTTALISTLNQTNNIPGVVNVRQAFIQGISTVVSTAQTVYPIPANTSGFGVVPAGTLAVSPAITGANNNDLITTSNPVKRYQVQFALGLFNQPKLIPTKFMASQLSIEITLANPSECMFAPGALNILPSYQLSNVNLIPEILEFDASYGTFYNNIDEMFLKGLMNGGVPIKFATYNNYKSTTSGASSVNIQIQERGRSVKSIFALQRRDPTTFTSDSGASFFCTGTNSTLPPSGGLVTLQEYQYRIGGRYYIIFKKIFPSLTCSECYTSWWKYKQWGSRVLVGINKSFKYGR